MTIKILIVDDQDLMRRGLRMFLSLHDEFEVVGEATNGYEAITLANMVKPDVILMDLMMPRMNGVEATQHLHKNQPSAKIIALSNSYDRQMIHAAIIAGVDTFIVKDAPPEKLVSAITETINGIVVLPDTALHKLFQDLPERNLNILSTDEKIILNLLTAKASNAEIAEELQTAIETVQAMICNMQAKLHVNSRLLLVLHDLKDWTYGKRQSSD